MVGVIGEGVGASDSATAGCDSEAEAGESVEDEGGGNSRFEMSSPSSARSAIVCPTGIPAVPAGTYENANRQIRFEPSKNSKT